MKNTILFVIPLLLMCVCLINSCNDEVQSSLTGSIIGNVLDNTTGEPVPTANVWLKPSGRSVVTGTDGNFQFSNLEVGKYSLNIEKVGYHDVAKEIEVSSGNISEINVLLERMPAMVTVDREVLDFGGGSDVNVLSFNIVNAGYEDLEWVIEYDCPWIKEIKDSSGVLAYGRTQAIAVYIDRTKISAEGQSKTTIIVRSSNGSCELLVKVGYSSGDDTGNDGSGSEDENKDWEHDYSGAVIECDLGIDIDIVSCVRNNDNVMLTFTVTSLHSGYLYFFNSSSQTSVNDDIGNVYSKSNIKFSTRGNTLGFGMDKEVSLVEEISIQCEITVKGASNTADYMTYKIWSEYDPNGTSGKTGFMKIKNVKIN